MSELVLSTQEAITAKLKLELMQSNYQQVQNILNSLEYTEDNLLQIQNAISNVNNLRKVVEEKHKEGKAAAWAERKRWDEAKKEMMVLIEDLVQTPQKKYLALVKEIDRKKKAVEADERRKKDIKDNIQKTIIILTDKIAAASSDKELVLIEKLIGSQKSKKESLQEFYDDFVAQLDSLTPIIKDQKDKLKKLAKLKKDSTNNSETNSGLISDLQNSIDENKIKAQETGLNTLINTSPIPYAQEVLPTVKAKRSVWKYEVLDINELAKKTPNLVRLVPDEEAIKKRLDEMKTDGSLKGKEEVIIGGLRIYLDKIY